jgi:hypothetical protein
MIKAREEKRDFRPRQANLVRSFPSPAQNTGAQYLLIILLTNVGESLISGFKSRAFPT